MKNMDDIRNLILFTNNKYFMLTENEIEKLSWEKVSNYDFEGICISAPTQVDLSKDRTFPVVMALGYNGIRNSILKEDRNIISLVFSETMEKLFIGPPRTYYKTIDYSKIDSIKENNLKNELENMRLAGCRLFNLRESLGIPWEPEVYRTTFIYYDWKSNTVTTELVSKEKKREAVSLSSPMTIEAEVPLKFCSKNIEPVLKFSVPDKVSLREKEILMKVEIRVPVGEYCRKVEAGRLIGWKNFCLLFVRKNQDQRPVLRYDFSVMGRKELEKGDEITSDLVLEGKFVIDLRKRVPDFFYDEIEYCCYLVSYEVIEGPSVITVVR